MKHTVAYGTSNLNESYYVNFNGRQIYMETEIEGFTTDTDAKEFMKSLYGEKYILVYIQSDTIERKMISSITMCADDGVMRYPSLMSPYAILPQMLDKIIESNKKMLIKFSNEQQKERDKLYKK